MTFDLSEAHTAGEPEQIGSSSLAEGSCSAAAEVRASAGAAAQRLSVGGSGSRCGWRSWRRLRVPVLPVPGGVEYGVGEQCEADAGEDECDGHNQAEDGDLLSEVGHVQRR